jgi:hypothetical protein
MRTVSLMLVLVVLIWLAFSRTAFAANGEVVLKNRGCDYFIVESNMGFAILEWYGGNDPSEGDILVGNYESYGMKDIYNETADAELRVWVDNFWLSKSRAIERYYDKCD